MTSEQSAIKGVVVEGAVCRLWMNIQAVVVVDGWVVMVVLLLNSAGVKCRRAHALHK